MELIERVAEAIIGAQCLGREGPFGGYDYGHNTEFYGPAPEGGRYVIRDFRTPKSRGEWLHQTDDNELHQSTFKKMTEEHIAKAAIRAMLDGVESNLSAVQYDPAPYTAMKHRIAAMRKEVE